MLRILDVSPEGELSTTDTSEALVPPEAGWLRWIDWVEPTADQLAALRAAFDFHPLSIEDCLHPNQRPKLEEYRDHLFVVTHSFEALGDGPTPERSHELHAFLGDRFLVTVRDFPSAAIDRVWDALSRDPNRAGRGSDFQLYLVTDAFLEATQPALDDISEQLGEVEDAVLEGADPEDLARILALKRRLLEMRRVMGPQRNVFAALARRPTPRVTDRTAPYFRDVYDSVVRLNEAIDARREHVAATLSAYLSVTSNQTNAIMKSLTLLSAIFLPLSFVTGFFGQNFTGLPYDSQAWLTAGLGLCVAVPAAMLLWFRSRHWL